MKILIIISSHTMDNSFLPNIIRLSSYFRESQDTVDYCGISSYQDIENYESIIQFKYKYISNKKQLGKICDFITENEDNLNYDWYIKIRPDIMLLEPINFDKLIHSSINARARMYRGIKIIEYGMSINGPGKWKSVGDCFYDVNENIEQLDDQLYIFDNNTIKRGAFKPIGDLGKEEEGVHTRVWKSRNIKLNIIGINLHLTTHDIFSGNLDPH
jgi:hypothetical protein